MSFSIHHFNYTENFVLHKNSAKWFVFIFLYQFKIIISFVIIYCNYYIQVRNELALVGKA